MQDLTYQELQHIKELSKPESLKGCARAYQVAVTYFPPLLFMVEKYLKLSVMERIKSGYSSGLTVDGTWCIRGPNSFEELIGRGEESKLRCDRLVSRLNGVL